MPLKKTILVALIIIGVLLIPVTVLLLLPDTEEVPAVTTDAPDTQILFDQNHAEHITGLVYQHKGKDKIALCTGSGGWQVEGRPGLPVDRRQIANLLSPFAQMLALRSIREECDDLSEYGLDEPLLSVTLTVHGQVKTYLFGQRNSYYEGHYCTLSGSGDIYLVDESYVTAFDTELADLLSTESLPDLAGQSIHWTNSAGSTETDTLELAKLLSTLRIERMLDYGKEQFAVYGLDTPAIATLTDADGQTETLRFAAGDADDIVYLVIGDREIIYLVTCEDMASLQKYIGRGDPLPPCTDA